MKKYCKKRNSNILEKKTWIANKIKDLDKDKDQKYNDLS